MCNISVGEVRRDDVMTRGKGVKIGVRCVVVVDLLIGERHIQACLGFFQDTINDMV